MRDCVINYCVPVGCVGISGKRHCSSCVCVEPNGQRRAPGRVRSLDRWMCGLTGATIRRCLLKIVACDLLDDCKKLRCHLD